MPDFEGTKAIILQPGDIAVPRQWEFTVCSGSTTNDGALPFEYSIDSVATTIHREDGTNLTTSILSTSSCTGNILTTWLTYTTVSPVPGKHHMKFTAVINNPTGTTEYTEEFDFNRLILKDI